MRVPRRAWSVAVVVAVLLAGCGGGGQPATTGSASPATGPTGAPLSKADILALAPLFSDNPLTGGQIAPRQYRWVNDRVAVFLQFDNADPAKATALRYVGVGVKGVFCAENQPGGANGGFPHFHRLDAPDYAHGHGGPIGPDGRDGWQLQATVPWLDQRVEEPVPGNVP
jgi:hypothetical protein